MLTREYSPLSESEYLQLEAQSPVKHEYVSGELFAMTGATLRHNTVALNLAAVLRARLRDTGCRVFIADVRLRVAKSNAYYYPDLLVHCSRDAVPVDMGAVTVHDPVLVVEVLSPATESTDRREKLLAYRTLSSLIEYVLVSQDQARVEIHRRHGDIGWQKIEYAGPEKVELASVELDIDMSDIYEGVRVEGLPDSAGTA